MILFFDIILIIINLVDFKYFTIVN